MQRFAFLFSAGTFLTVSAQAEELPLVVGASREAESASQERVDKGAFILPPVGPAAQQGEWLISSAGDWEFQGLLGGPGAEASASGVAAERVMETLQIRYGILDGLNLTLSLPHTALSSRSLSGATYRKSEAYLETRSQIEKGLIDVMRSQALCTNDRTCRNLINQGFALGRDDVTLLPGGEPLPLRAGVPLKDVVDAAAVGRGLVEDGDTGIGDISLEVGASVFDREKSTSETAPRFRLSASLIGDFPTGSFESVPRSQVPTGVGVARLGAGIFLDFQPEEHILLGAGYRLRAPLGTASQRPSSYVDSTLFLAEGASPVTWQGLWQNSSIRFGYDWSQVFQALSGLTMAATWTLESAPGATMEGVTVREERSLQTVEASARFAVLSLFLPFALELAYREPLFETDSSQVPALARLRAMLDFQLLSTEDSGE